MRNWVGAVIAVFVVLGLAIGAAVVRYTAVTPVAAPEIVDPIEADAGLLPALPPADGPQPSADVPEMIHDFGTAQVGGSGTHEFTIENTGDFPLELALGPTSCQCTLAGIDESRIEPGAQGAVRLDWTVEAERPKFEQTAVILTNDPKRRRITFVVRGKIVLGLAASPRQVIFSHRADETVTKTTRISTNSANAFEATGYHFEDPAVEEFFDVEFAPFERTGTVSGRTMHSVQASITAKPGLPLGTVKHKLFVEHDIENVAPAMVYVVTTVKGDLTVVAPGWNEKAGVLRLGDFDGRGGDRRQLALLVRGPHRDAVNVNLANVDPKFLRVKVGEKTASKNGRVYRIPIEIEVPPGTPPANFAGNASAPYGVLTFETDEAEIPGLRIGLMFSVSG